MQIYKLSWCDQNYVWERDPCASTEHTSFLSSVSWKVYPSLPETNASVQKLSINPPGLPNPIISETNEPKTFVGHVPTYLFMYHLAAHLSAQKKRVIQHF